QAEALERERAQPELAPGLEQLRPAEAVHAVAVRELEAERVELPARHRDAETGAVLRVLEREEDARPAIRAAQLGDLALDPDRRPALEPRGDAAVEGADLVDLAIAIRSCLDLHEARIGASRA